MPIKKSFTPPDATNSEAASLFERIAGILESGRGRVLRSINHETVLVYWLIGREIVQALQSGEARAGIDRKSTGVLSYKNIESTYNPNFAP